MTDELWKGEGALQPILDLDRNAPGFRDTLREILGDFEEWEDEGDVYFTASRAGVEVLTDSGGPVGAVFLFGPGSDEGTEYQGPLPGGLDFRMSRDEVRSLLGDPDDAGEPKMHLGDLLSPWDKYRLGGYWLHARYTLDGSRIDRVTVTPVT